MNIKILGIGAVSVALLIGLAYAGSPNSIARGLGQFNLTTANGITTIGNRPVDVNCVVGQESLPVNSVVHCGNWSVTLLGTSGPTNNLTVSRFMVNMTESANATADNGITQNAISVSRTVYVVSGISSRVCMHGRGDMARYDRGVGVGHSCLFISVASATQSSAEVQLVGLTFLRPVPMPEHENDDGHGNGDGMANAIAGGPYISTHPGTLQIWHRAG